MFGSKPVTNPILEYLRCTRFPKSYWHPGPRQLLPRRYPGLGTSVEHACPQSQGPIRFFQRIFQMPQDPARWGVRWPHPGLLGSAACRSLSSKEPQALPGRSRQVRAGPSAGASGNSLSAKGSLPAPLHEDCGSRLGQRTSASGRLFRNSLSF